MKNKEYEALNVLPLDIKTDEELKEYVQPLYIIEDEMGSKERYKYFMEKMKKLNRATFPHTLSKYPIKFKFYRNDEKTYEMQLRHFIIELFIWQPYLSLVDCRILDDSCIFDCKKMIGINDFLSTKIIRDLSKYNINNIKINKDISEINSNLLELAGDFALPLGLSITVKEFSDIYNRNDNIRRIMTSEFKENAQPAEMEEQMSSEQTELIQRLKNEEKGTTVSIMVNVPGCVKHKQLYEFMGKQGLKSDLNNRTFTKGNSNSILIGGMERPSDAYREATGSRKSQVQNHNVMGTAGGFARKANILTRSISMSTTVADCGSTHLVEYTITNAKMLKLFDGKYYRLPEEEDLHVIDGLNDTHLIGKTILVRSIATCALHDGKICQTCIGKISKWNFDIADGFFIMLTQEWTSVLQQNILSTKHLLTTNSEKITANENPFVEIRGGGIYPIGDERQLDNIDDYAIVILPEDIRKEEEFDYDSMYNTYIYNGRFFIRNLKKPGEKMFEIKIEPEIESEKELYIAEEYLSYFMKKGNTLKFKDIEDFDIPIFETIINNNELTKPLYDLMNLLDTTEKTKYYNTISSFSQKMAEIFVSAGFNTNLASCECMVNRLIRCSNPDDPSAIYCRPDFSQSILEPYEIIPIKKALEYHPSPLIGISSQYVKRQLTKHDLFKYRNESSYMDPLFKEDVSTQPFKDYWEYQEKVINNSIMYNEDGDYID